MFYFIILFKGVKRLVIFFFINKYVGIDVSCLFLFGFKFVCFVLG